MPTWLNQLWQRCQITADELTTRTRGVLCASEHSAQSAKPLQVGDLEPRVLFSATPMDAASLPGADEGATMVAEVDPGQQESETDQQQSTTELAQSAREIVIVDGSVESLDQLLDDLAQSRPGAEVFVLDSERDGIQQITEILDNRSEIESLHIVSHGNDQGVQLGNLWLTNASLDGYAGQIASWCGSFSADADILFYGCDLASSSEGQDLVQALSALTGADVAASVDVTGHDSLGGDWELEFGVGTIET